MAITSIEMKRLIKLPLRDGGFVLVEVNVEESLHDAGIVEDVININETFDAAIDGMKPIVQSIIDKFEEIKQSKHPNQISVEFGLGFKLDSEGMLRIFIPAQIDSSIKVGFIWSKESKCGATQP